MQSMLLLQATQIYSQFPHYLDNNPISNLHISNIYLKPLLTPLTPILAKPTNQILQSPLWLSTQIRYTNYVGRVALRVRTHSGENLDATAVCLNVIVPPVWRADYRIGTPWL